MPRLEQHQILDFADVVEAMVSHRRYRSALGVDTTLDAIVRLKGSAFDATLVDICIALFKEHYFEFNPRRLDAETGWTKPIQASAHAL
jgi:HD-GYP domain-containing protein (c-di-GMP phosphodiesterase class II)